MIEICKLYFYWPFQVVLKISIKCSVPCTSMYDVCKILTLWVYFSESLQIGKLSIFAVFKWANEKICIEACMIEVNLLTSTHWHYVALVIPEPILANSNSVNKCPCDLTCHWSAPSTLGLLHVFLHHCLGLCNRNRSFPKSAKIFLPFNRCKIPKCFFKFLKSCQNKSSSRWEWIFLELGKCQFWKSEIKKWVNT